MAAGVHRHVTEPAVATPAVIVRGLTRAFNTARYVERPRVAPELADIAVVDPANPRQFNRTTGRTP
jgi:hypothetical protein